MGSVTHNGEQPSSRVVSVELGEALKSAGIGFLDNVGCILISNYQPPGKVISRI
jgi:hypothetical protein